MTTVYIEPVQDELLKALSARTKIPVAEYIRQGIDLVLEQNREDLPGQLSLFDEAKARARAKQATAEDAAQGDSISSR